jgi:hypothetical protein
MNFLGKKYQFDVLELKNKRISSWLKRKSKFTTKELVAKILCWFNSREQLLLELKAVDYIVKTLKTKFWIT